MGLNLGQPCGRPGNEQSSPHYSHCGVPVPMVLRSDKVEGLSNALCCNRDSSNQGDLLVSSQFINLQTVACEFQVLQQLNLLGT